MLTCLQSDAAECVFDLFNFGFEVLEAGFEFFVLEDEMLEGVDVTGKRGLNALVYDAFGLVEGLLKG